MSTSNDNAWKDLFSDTNAVTEIHSKGISYISARTMKKYREPRLMAKIDTSELLPQVFRKHKLSILPVKNGEYAIFEDPDKLSFFKFPEDFDKINVEKHNPRISLANFDSFQNLEDLNEAQALDTALIASVIKDFTNEEELWLTIRGRQFTNDFKVFIPSIHKYLNISKVQIEVDAGYESKDAIYIFEAKIGKRENFNIRQLLFPYLEWKNRTTKPVIPVFFFFTNGFYYLFQFDLGDSLDASSIIKRACYTLYEIETFELANIIENANLDDSLVKNIPFPQANDLDKVIDTVSLVNQGYINKEGLSEVLEFDERQGDYYANAARFIGFLDKVNNNFFITDVGKELLKLKSPSNRARLVAIQLVNRPVFNRIFNMLLKQNLNGEGLDYLNIPQIILEQTYLNETTSERRSSTVRNWINWIFRYAE
jgi:hypothetical protein